MWSKFILRLTAFLLCGMNPLVSEEPAATVIEIDGDVIIRSVEVNPTGFCLSFLDDSDAGNHKTILSRQLKSMRIGSLRYPMGALGENYLFHDLSAGSPVEGKLQPRVITTQKPPGSFGWAVNPDGSFKPRVLDFDGFVNLYRESGAEPVVLVATYGQRYSVPRVDDEVVLRNAEEWVRYSNVIRKLGIKYWEIGNEVSLRSAREVISQEQYLDIFMKMATRMKAIDPSIRTGLGTTQGAAGLSTPYFRKAMATFPELVDFVVVHEYMGQIESYEKYLHHSREFLNETVQTLAAIDKEAPVQRRKSTEILITEFSSFPAGKKFVSPERSLNSIFSALLTFEMLAEGICLDDRVRFLHFWVTHNPWHHNRNTDITSAFGPDNEVLPQGRAVEIMGRFIQDRMVKVSCPSGSIRCWAGTSRNAPTAAIWLLNRAREEQRVSVRLHKIPDSGDWSTWQLAGTEPDDTSPAWGAGKVMQFQSGTASIQLPPLSITVLYQ